MVAKKSKNGTIYLAEIYSMVGRGGGENLQHTLSSLLAKVSHLSVRWWWVWEAGLTPAQLINYYLPSQLFLVLYIL